MTQSARPGPEPERADLDAARAELLEPIAELAIAVARRDGADPKAPIPPKALHPYLRFARLPAAALTAAVAATDADEGFRARVAEACADDPALTEGQRAWLVRGDGWQEVFDGEVGAAAAVHAEARAERTDVELRERVASLEEQLSERSERLAEAQRELDRLRRTVDAHEVDLAALRDERARWQEKAAAADEARHRAVRELKDTEARSVDRLERVRALEAEVEALAAGTGGEARSAPESAPPVEGVPAEALRPLADRLDALAKEVAALAGGEARQQEAHRSGGQRTEGQRGGERGATRPRRRRFRLQQGILEGTPEAALQLLAVPDAIVLVDGWNVSMLGWPDLPGPLQRQRLVDALGGLAARTGAEIHVVFDGIASGGAPVAHGAGRVRVQFTPEGVEADDRILELVDAVAPERHVIVVSNDRRVRAGAEERSANVVGSTELLSLISGR